MHDRVMRQIHVDVATGVLQWTNICLQNLRYVMFTSNLKESNMLMDFQYKVIVKSGLNCLFGALWIVPFYVSNNDIFPLCISLNILYMVPKWITSVNQESNNLNIDELRQWSFLNLCIMRSIYIMLMCALWLQQDVEFRFKSLVRVNSSFLDISCLC